MKTADNRGVGFSRPGLIPPVLGLIFYWRKICIV